jgi:tRNA(His) 5'-end guanylyltransferase
VDENELFRHLIRRWRQGDAARCLLNGWAYWTLRKAGQGVAQATPALEGKSMADKNELLFQALASFHRCEP